MTKFSLFLQMKKQHNQMATILAHRFDLNAGDMLGKHFQVVKLLGQGTFGIVYLVLDLRDNIHKAIKVLKLYNMEPRNREDISKRFEREFQCGQIKSPYLVRASDKGEHRGNPYFIMEYCRHGSVKKWVGKSPDFNSVKNFAISTLLGLEILHKNGIIHRDLKPDNVLLGDRHAKLTDFGIAGFQNSRLTRVNLRGHAKDIFGTYAYISPEQANSRKAFKALGPTADLWSFGVTLYEIICGHLPFGKLEDQPDLGEYLRRSSQGRFDPIQQYRSDVPFELNTLINRCLQNDHNKRINNTTEALEILGHNINTKSEETIRISSSYTFGKDLFGLRVMHGEENGRIYNLSRAIPHANGSATIGWFDMSNPTNNSLTIVEKQSAYISRYHATIEKNDGQRKWIIRDGQHRSKEGKIGWYPSLNGTFVNGKKVAPDSKGKTIQPNDIITIGDTTLKVVFQSMTT